MTQHILPHPVPRPTTPLPKPAPKPAPKPEPVAAPALPATTLYATEAGDTVAISAADIHQGQIGDCFLLAAIGEIAFCHPAAIARMIHANANGTETVTLYGDPRGHLSATGEASRAFAVVVDHGFATNGVNGGAGQDVVHGQKEIWPQVLEHAYAQASGGYGAIAHGGSPVLALAALTGHAATWQSPTGLSLTELQADMQAGDLIVMDTRSTGSLPFGLVGSHAYMFEGLVGSAGSAAVRLGNPWGDHQPALIPFAQLAQGIVEVDVGHLA